MRAAIEFFINTKLPLLIVFTRELTKLALFAKTGILKANFSAVELLLILLAWQLMQFVFATAFSLLSDKWGKKKVMFIVMPFAAVGAYLITNPSLPLLILALIIDGIFGASITPIGRSAYLITDSNLSKGKDIAVTNTLLAQVLPWTLAFIPYFYTNVGLASLLLLATTLFLLLFFDSPPEKSEKHELRKTTKKYGLDGLRLLLSFLFHCIAYQYSIYYPEEHLVRESVRMNLSIMGGSGLLVGCLLQKLGYVKPSYQAITLSYFFLVGPLLTSKLFFSGYLDVSTALSFACGGGIILSLSFGYFVNLVASSEMGFTNGAMESLEILAELLLNLFTLITIFGIPILTIHPIADRGTPIDNMLMFSCLGVLVLLLKSDWRSIMTNETA